MRWRAILSPGSCQSFAGTVEQTDDTYNRAPSHWGLEDRKGHKTEFSAFGGNRRRGEEEEAMTHSLLRGGEDKKSRKLDPKVPSEKSFPLLILL